MYKYPNIIIRTSVKLLTAVAAIMITVACSAQQQPSDQSTSLREDIGQMLMVGFRGTECNPSSTIYRDIKDYHIGGVILFEYDAPSRRRPRNITSPEQLRTLCTSLQNIDTSTLLIGIDQEGGKVNRLKEEYGFPPSASARYCLLQGYDSVRYYALSTARTLAKAGINLNFAPCVDVNINPSCPIIGALGRSYSANADSVIEAARIVIAAHKQHGVATCLKHFPGHGSASGDTHSDFVDVSSSWQACELEPYRQLCASQEAGMIMTSHVFNSHFDSLYPATLSFNTLTTLLREKLHFNGVIITDDMVMGAITRHYGYEEALCRAINAGTDMLCLSNNGEKYNADIVPQTVKIIESMVAEGRISADRIHSAAERVRKLKRSITQQ